MTIAELRKTYHGRICREIIRIGKRKSGKPGTVVSRSSVGR